jgi:hypothetical protein
LGFLFTANPNAPYFTVVHTSGISWKSELDSRSRTRKHSTYTQSAYKLVDVLRTHCTDMQNAIEKGGRLFFSRALDHIFYFILFYFFAFAFGFRFHRQRNREK